MKTIYKTIKQTARKYALPALIAGSMTLGSCSNEDASYLPIDQEFQTELVAKNKRTIDSLIQLGDENVKNARTEAIEMSKDNYISINEMQDVLSQYDSAENKYEQANEKTKTLNFQEFEEKSLFKKDQKLYDRISRTINGFDLGKPEIQKDYEKQGLDVEVENHSSNTEEWLGIGMAVFTLLGVMVGTGILMGEE